jgi:hypothetical protein
MFVSVSVVFNIVSVAGSASVLSRNIRYRYETFRVIKRIIRPIV